MVEVFFFPFLAPCPTLSSVSLTLPHTHVVAESLLSHVVQVLLAKITPVDFNSLWSAAVKRAIYLSL